MILFISVPPSIDNKTASKSNLTVVLGSKLVIDCPVKGIPLPEITWFKNDDVITPNENISFSDGDRRFLILRAGVPDAAVYKCLGSNEAGNTTKQFNVDVHGKSITGKGNNKTFSNCTSYLSF